jgi:hypothetical protein
VTLENERTAMRQFLRFAERRGYISEEPEFSIKSGRTNARPDIPEVEWHRLIRCRRIFGLKTAEGHIGHSCSTAVSITEVPVLLKS